MQKFGRLVLLFFLTFMFLFQLPSTGQNKKFFVITGKIVPEIETSEGGTIDILKGNGVTKMDIPKNGRFKLDLEFFNEYTLIFTLPGHFSKTITISTEIPQDVWERDNNFPAYPIVVQLFKEIEGVDKSFTLKPSGKIFYSKKTDNFENESYSIDSQVAAQIAAAKKQSEQVKKEAQTITKQDALDLAAKQKDFDQQISEADLLFKKGDYQAALKKYQGAQTLFPEKAYASDRIAELEDLVKALEISQKQKAELEQKYKNAIARADGFFEQKTYKEAQLYYKEALQSKPDDAYATGRVQETGQLLSLLEKQKQFDDLVAQADDNYKSKKFDKAVSLYTQAKQLIPEKEYPQNQINLINQEKQQLAKLEQLEKEFTTTIQNGDKLVKQKDFLQAINLYKEALELKPDSKLASDKITETEQTIAGIETDKKYQEAIKQADQALAGDDLQNAKTYYQGALKLKSEEAYPKSKLAEIALKESNETKFSALVVDAEKAVTDQRYEESVNILTQALQIKPKDPAVQKRIDEVQILKKQQVADKEFEKTILLGDQQKAQEKYDIAINLYRDALKIKPNNELALGKISEVEQIFAGREKEKQYQATIAQADKSFDGKDYVSAQADYRKSLTYKPNETYPANRIKEIDQILEKNQQAKLQDDNYKSAITKADKAFGSESYADARKSYSEALAIKPSETYPTGQISKIDEMLAEKAKLQQAENEFQALVSKGDAAFGQKDYESAKTNYSSALGLKPNSAEVKAKIKNIDDILQKIADDKRKEEARLLALASEKEKADAERQKEELYASTIKEGETLFTNKDFSGARLSFVKATELKPAEPLPVRRIKDIDKILADLALAETKNNATELSYQETIKRADQSLVAKEYSSARSTYSEALSIKPTEQYPKDKIAEIDQIMADHTNQQYNQAIAAGDLAFKSDQLDESTKQYELALSIKANDQYAKKQLAEITKRRISVQDEQKRLKKIDDQYASLLLDANVDFKNKEYQKAKDKFQTASSLKPSETLPKEQIVKIDVLLNEARNAEETNRLYSESVKTAEGAFKQNKLKEALDAYQKASEYKPSEPVPPKRITEINSMIAQQEAAQMLTKQQAAKDSLAKARDDAFNQAISSAKELARSKQYLDAIQKYKDAIEINPSERANVQKQIAALESQIQLLDSQDKQYSQIIAKADQLFEEKKLAEALPEYRNASNIKTTEDYPKNQIIEIQKIIASQKEAYANAINNGDKAFNESDWQKAKDAYTEALAVKPNEAYPQKRLKETDQKISAMIDQKNKESLAQSKRLIDEKYRQALSLADNTFKEKTYSSARSLYQEAQLIKPDESYPKNQIALIEKLINQAKTVEPIVQKQAVTKTEQPVTAPAFNPEESAQTTEARAQSFQTVNDYGEAIRKADDSFGGKDYSVARFFYYKASELKPEEEYPKNQIELIRKLVDAELSTIDRTGYEQAIFQADGAFDKKNYSVSKFYYYKALEIKSWEKYPKDRIHEILVLTHSLLSEKEEKEYQELIAKADEAFAGKDISLSRFYYHKALSIKKDEEYPKIKLKDIQKLIDQNQLDQLDLEYNKLIELADQALKSENYSIARFNYNKALGMRPNEKYPKDQLKLIKETLDKPKTK